MVRFSLKNQGNINNEVDNENIVNTNENITVNNQENIEEPDSKNKELQEMFSNIDLNNYNFRYVVNIKDSVSIIEGKRYNDKYSFTLENNGSFLYFNGTSNYIKARESEDGVYKLTGFPYVLINIFDSNVLKQLINESNLNNGVFEISNESISKLANKSLSNNEAINTVEVYLKENKIDKVDLDLSNAISSFMNETVSAKISLEFTNFGLVEDFRIE
jgi:hypothetical protein